MTSPVRTFQELPPGSPAPDFTLPKHPAGTFTLSSCRGESGVVLYFTSELFPLRNENLRPPNYAPTQEDNPQAVDLITLADALERTTGPAVRLAVVSRQPYQAAAARPFLTYSLGRVSLLVDADAAVGRLYGCHCREKHFGRNYGYDQAPLVCLVDRQGIARLHGEVSRILPELAGQPLSSMEAEDQLWRFSAGMDPQPVSIALLLHLARKFSS